MDTIFDTTFPLPDFTRMIELYKEWNERINVISRKDIDNIYEHHILHSLCIALYLKERRPQEFLRWTGGGLSVLDLGCGGGFPGIPLATCFPGVQFTLCDSIGKKVTVAREIASSLGLSNVQCVNCRAESLPGQWDWIVSRAVTSLDNFLPWVNGRFKSGILYLKGGDITAEMEACWKKFGRKMPPADVWNISSVLHDEYFSEKIVVNLGNCQK